MKLWDYECAEIKTFRVNFRIVVFQEIAWYHKTWTTVVQELLIICTFCHLPEKEWQKCFLPPTEKNRATSNENFFLGGRGISKIKMHLILPFSKNKSVGTTHVRFFNSILSKQHKNKTFFVNLKLQKEIFLRNYHLMIKSIFLL